MRHQEMVATVRSKIEMITKRRGESYDRLCHSMKIGLRML